jgi:cytidylate kinase
MKNEALHLVKSIIDAGVYAAENKDANTPTLKRPLVTVSRYYGAAGSNVATLLAEHLGVQLYDKELLTAIVNETKDDKHLLASLDERVGGLMDDILLAFFSKKSINSEAYFRYMAKVIMGISPIGGVIVGRAAHLLLPKKRTFRVRLEGSLPICAKRMAKRKDMPLHKAEKLVIESNQERDKFERQVVKRFPRAEQGFDLTLNTDRFSPPQAVNIIITAMTEAGFQVSSEKA